MSYLLGEQVPLHFELTVNGTDTDAPAIVVTIIKPDGTTTQVTPAHDGTGVYDEAYTPATAGRYSWVATVSGGITAVASGVFDVIDPLDQTAPLTGVAPWTDAAAIRRRPGCSLIDQRDLDDAARAASDILYALTGRQFTGTFDGYTRPTARPNWVDGPSWAGAGWFGTWGTCSYAYGSGYGSADAWSSHRCSCYPPQVELGAYPVLAVSEVKIDGTTIPAGEYRIDERRLLVRVLPTVASTPTERYGWPTCQRLDLPDTEPGTFSVRFRYGAPPPTAGVRAATALAAELALTVGGDVDTRLPERVRSIVRQGESITLIDPQDVLDQGRTGIPEVDLFIKAINPAGLTRRSSVWSPDIGHTRRPTTPAP